MENLTTIGIVSPGAMGAALGRAWSGAGFAVVATVAGRSERTARLAAGLELLPSLTDVVAAAELVVSIVPPEHALANAEAIAGAARSASVRPLVLDANATAPASVFEVAATLAAAGCDLVDGSISGAPPHADGSTTLYLSGPRAGELAGLGGAGLTPRLLDDRVGTASAVKMCTASMYKGFSALLTQALLTARAHGVVDVVQADLAGAFGGETERAATLLALAAAKSDRFPGEMREIALTQGDAGAEPALFEAMAQVWSAVHRSALAAHDPEEAARMQDLELVLTELGQPRAG